MEIFLYILMGFGALFVFLILSFPIIITIIILKSGDKPKIWFYKKIDNYIIKCHSGDYIRRSMVQNEMSRRIESAIRENNKMRDIQEHTAVEKVKLDFEILEDGWVAEIENFEKIIKSVYELRDDTMKVRAKVKRWGKQLAMLTANNAEVGKNIIDSTCDNVGELDKIGINVKGIYKEIDDDTAADDRALRIK